MSEHLTEDPGYTQDPTQIDPSYDPGTETQVMDPAFYDVNVDGVTDTYTEQAETGEVVALVDQDQDGRVDLVLVDADQDGAFERSITQDADGSYVVTDDTDGDGYGDTSTVSDEANPDLDSAFGLGFTDGADGPALVTVDDSADPVLVDPGTETPQAEDTIAGDPDGDSAHWFEQAKNGYCLPASVAQISSEYLGFEIADESWFVDKADEMGLMHYDADGNPVGVEPDKAVDLLNSVGIPAHTEYSSMEGLAQDLEDGRRVMVAVDSGELWYGETVEDNKMDHAIVVTGVDFENQLVYVDDPGNPNGQEHAYPLDVFEDAWKDSNYTAIVCDQTPEEFAAEHPDLADQGGADDGAPSDPIGVDLGAGSPSSAENAVSWATEHKWMMLPVALVAAKVVASATNRK